VVLRVDKRYQVFVSSTYLDLQAERQEVMQALLELECIPAGMELFPAGNEDQWSLIRSVIDDCDYYIAIVGGRYGSQGPDGLSYTEMEYRYAVEKGKPVMAFLYKRPDELPVRRSEDTPEGRQKLDGFRELVQQRVCRYWEHPGELGSAVSRSLIKLIKSNPAVGWIKADAVSGDTSREILRLRQRIDDLERELSTARVQAPAGAEHLAQGADVFRFPIDLMFWSTEGEYMIQHTSFGTPWNQVFRTLAPFMLGDASDAHLADEFAAYVKRRCAATTSLALDSVTIHPTVMGTIKVQLRALGLITKSQKSRSIKDTATYWTLTSYGDEILTQLTAVRRLGGTDQVGSVETNAEIIPEAVSDTPA
jgi:hypothetical protein